MDQSSVSSCSNSDESYQVEEYFLIEKSLDHVSRGREPTLSQRRNKRENTRQNCAIISPKLGIASSEMMYKLDPTKCTFAHGSKELHRN